MAKANLDEFEKRIKIRFKDKNLLRQVFVHRSYLNENVGFDLDHNERLEFLGDAVLELVVTHHLFSRYKNPEGELTNWRSALVKGTMLSAVAKSLEMDDYLFLSKGEQKSAGKARELILANTFEALIGAIYLDQGYEAARRFVERTLLARLPEIIEKRLYLDPKSHLQQLVQEQKGITPVYRVLSEYGPDHAKSFSVGVFVEEKLIGEGSGSSKQAAEQAAASSGLEYFTELT
jgi:ribonuclease-3